MERVIVFVLLIVIVSSAFLIVPVEASDDTDWIPVDILEKISGWEYFLYYRADMVSTKGILLLSSEPLMFRYRSGTDFYGVEYEARYDYTIQAGGAIDRGSTSGYAWYHSNLMPAVLESGQYISSHEVYRYNSDGTVFEPLRVMFPRNRAALPADPVATPEPVTPGDVDGNGFYVAGYLMGEVWRVLSSVYVPLLGITFSSLFVFVFIAFLGIVLFKLIFMKGDGS